MNFSKLQKKLLVKPNDWWKFCSLTGSITTELNRSNVKSTVIIPLASKLRYYFCFILRTKCKLSTWIWNSSLVWKLRYEGFLFIVWDYGGSIKEYWKCGIFDKNCARIITENYCIVGQHNRSPCTASVQVCKYLIITT